MFGVVDEVEEFVTGGRGGGAEGGDGVGGEGELVTELVDLGVGEVELGLELVGAGAQELVVGLEFGQLVVELLAQGFLLLLELGLEGVLVCLFDF